MNETLAVWERVKKRFGIKSEVKSEPKPVVRPMELGITAALKGDVTSPPTGEAAKPLPYGDGTYINSPSAKG